MIKKLLAISLIALLISWSGVGFKSSLEVDSGYDYATSYSDGNVEGHKRGADWPDKRARYRAGIIKHTVKVSEDVVVKDIMGVTDTIEDASSGSGAVINADTLSNTSLILTAEHVCDEYTPGQVVGMGMYVIESSTKWIITVNGKKLKAKTIFADPANDVCIMQAEGIAGVPASVGAFHPPKGARIYTAGAPAGVWDKGVTNIEEGIYAGQRTKKICVPGRCFKGMLQYSIPIVGGMSGSGVYYKGRIVGLITMGTSRYEHVGWGPGLGPIRAAVEKGREIWYDSLPDPNTYE